MPANSSELEKRLWGAADEFRANSGLKSSEYSVPVLGLIFLRYADHKFTQAKAKIASQGTGRRTIGKADYQAQGVLYLPATVGQALPPARRAAFSPGAPACGSRFSPSTVRRDKEPAPLRSRLVLLSLGRPYGGTGVGSLTLRKAVIGSVSFLSPRSTG